MKSIVLAGGLGTRLAGITSQLPKPMAPIGKRPFLGYLLDYLHEQGVTEVVLAVSYKWEMIRDYFGDNYHGISLQYSVETEPLGTGGAIRQALEFSGMDEAVVLNGDTLFRVELKNFIAAHQERGVMLSVALKHVADTDRFGRVEVSEDFIITDFLEKAAGGPGWINGGVYIVSKDLFDCYPMPERFSFEQDLVEPNIGSIRPLAFCSDAYFIDMGIPEDYARAQREIG